MGAKEKEPTGVAVQTPSLTYMFTLHGVQVNVLVAVDSLPSAQSIG